MNSKTEQSAEKQIEVGEQTKPVDQSPSPDITSPETTPEPDNPDQQSGTESQNAEAFRQGAGRIIPSEDGKGLALLFRWADQPLEESRLFTPEAVLNGNFRITVNPTVEDTKNTQSYEINVHSFRNELNQMYGAFFAKWEDWSMGSRFRMRSKLWAFLYSVTEAIKRDGLNIDSELLEVGLLAIRACRDFEGERSSDLDELEEKIGAVEEIMIPSRNQSGTFEEDLNALLPDNPEIF